MSDLLAIDVGSSRVKLGWFPEVGSCDAKPQAGLSIAAPSLPEPAERWAVVHRDRPRDQWYEELREVLVGLEGQSLRPQVLVASVHPGVLAEVQSCFAGSVWPVVDVLCRESLPLEVQVDEPERVGIDRLLNALAAQMCGRDESTIVIDAGTALKVDLAGPATGEGAAQAAFTGGAILPGLLLSSRALRTGTASLPEIGLDELAEPPAVLGKSTQQAIAAGLYWGSIGAARELVTRLAAQCDRPRVLVTGGDGERFATHLQEQGRATGDAAHGETSWKSVRWVPTLTLSGIWAAAQANAQSSSVQPSGGTSEDARP